MVKLAVIATVAASLPTALAQVAAWGQCGGQGWTVRRHFDESFEFDRSFF